MACMYGSVHLLECAHRFDVLILIVDNDDFTVEAHLLECAHRFDILILIVDNDHFTAEAHYPFSNQGPFHNFRSSQCRYFVPLVKFNVSGRGGPCKFFKLCLES